MQGVKRFLMIGALLVLSGSGAAHAQIARSTSAPSDRAELLAFAMQPDPGDGSDTQPPVKNEEPKGKGDNPSPTPAPPINTPTFEKPDTSKTGGFNEAPLETLGAGTTNRTFGGAAATLPVARHPRRGILGIHPLAILAVLIAVHVFVVTRVVK